jgi:prophage regulatory protein
MAIPVAPIDPQTVAPLRLIRLPELMHRTALSRSEIYRRVRDHRLPAPVSRGAHCVAWVEAEVEAYLQDCISQRDAKAGAV